LYLALQAKTAVRASTRVRNRRLLTSSTLSVAEEALRDGIVQARPGAAHRPPRPQPPPRGREPGSVVDDLGEHPGGEHGTKAGRRLQHGRVWVPLERCGHGRFELGDCVLHRGDDVDQSGHGDAEGGLGLGGLTQCWRVQFAGDVGGQARPIAAATAA
jgi:hypothetical protein